MTKPLDQWIDENGLLEFQGDVMTHVSMFLEREVVGNGLAPENQEDIETLTRLIMISLRDKLGDRIVPTPMRIEVNPNDMTVKVKRIDGEKETVEAMYRISEGKPAVDNRPPFREDGSIVEFIEHSATRLQYSDMELALELQCGRPLETLARLVRTIRELSGIVQPGMSTESLARSYVTQRATNCAGCGMAGKVQVTFKYNETGKLEAADITGIQEGWKMMPYGDAGGEAPYCAECLEAKKYEAMMPKTKEEP